VKRILVIEDDLDIRDIVAFNLEREGYEVALASDGEEGLLTFVRHAFDLVILDIMMPKLNGLKVLESIRSRSDVPVLIMSAKTSEEDRLEGLSRMADDYICKPFSMKELLLRVKNHLYRYDRKSRLITWGEYTIDEESGVVRRGETLISLTKKELQLLLMFAKNPGKTYTREELTQAFWGYQHASSEDRTVDVTIRRLREKIETDASEPRYIISKRGIGYTAGGGR